MTRKKCYMFLVIFLASLVGVFNFPEFIFANDASFYFTGVILMASFYFGIISIIVSLAFKYIFTHDPEYKDALLNGFFGIFSLLIWKELKEDN